MVFTLYAVRCTYLLSVVIYFCICGTKYASLLEEDDTFKAAEAHRIHNIVKYLNEHKIRHKYLYYISLTAGKHCII